MNWKQLADNPWLFLIPVIATLAVGTIPPTVLLAYETLVSWTLNRPWTQLPFVGLKNYVDVFSSQFTYLALATSGIFVLSSLAIELTLGLGVALLFHRMTQRRLPGVGILRTIFILPMVVAPVVVGLFWRIMYHPTSGVINYFLFSLGLPTQPFLGSTIEALPCIILAEVWEWTPLVVLTMVTGLSLLPQEPFEAAEIDGASSWVKFRELTYPLVRPLLFALLIIRTIDLLKWMDTIYIMTGGGPGTATETLAYHIYNVAFRAFHLDQGGVLTVIALVIAVVLANLFNKMMMRR